MQLKRNEIIMYKSIAKWQKEKIEDFCKRNQATKAGSFWENSSDVKIEAFADNFADKTPRLQLIKLRKNSLDWIHNPFSTIFSSFCSRIKYL